MPDIIKFKRSEVGTSLVTTAIKPNEGEPVYDFDAGKLYVGEGENGSTIAQLDDVENYMLRWDKVVVPTEKIADRAVNSDKLASASVTTEKIGNLQVTNEKISSGIAGGKLLSKSVTLAQLDVSGSATSTNPTALDSYIDARAKRAAGSGVTVDSAVALTSKNIGSSTVPVYFGSLGKPVACTAYAGGTRLTLNGESKSGLSASLYAPTSSGSSGQLLVSRGSGTNPVWTSTSSISVNYSNSSGRATVADKADLIKINGDYYKATFTSGVLHFVKQG